MLHVEGFVAICGGICCLYVICYSLYINQWRGLAVASNLVVCKSNALVEAAYRLSVQEQRIVLACIAQVRRDEPVTDEVMYSVSAEDVATMAGVSIESSYTQLKEAALRLKRREVRFAYQPNGARSSLGRALPDGCRPSITSTVRAVSNSGLAKTCCPI